MYHPIDPEPTHQPTVAPSPVYTCELMNETVLTVYMTFYAVGQYVFVAVFYNYASRTNGTIPFGVIQSEFTLFSLVDECYFSSYTHTHTHELECIHVKSAPV